MERVRSLTLFNLKNEQVLKRYCFLFSFLIHSAIIIPYLPENDFFKTLNFSQVISNEVSLKVSLASVERKQEKPKVSSKGLKKKQKFEKEISHFVKGEQKEIKQSTGSNTVLAQYLSKVRTLIDNMKEYPKTARRLKHQGKVKVEILINAEGRILSNQLIKRSDSILLNKATEEIFVKLKSFDKLPKEITTRPLKVIVPVSYQL